MFGVGVIQAHNSSHLFQEVDLEWYLLDLTPSPFSHLAAE